MTTEEKIETIDHYKTLAHHYGAEHLTHLTRNPDFTSDPIVRCALASALNEIDPV